MAAFTADYSKAYSLKYVKSLLSSRAKGEFMPPNKIEILVVVNGQQAPIGANANSPLRSIVGKALQDTGNTGQGAENWELRDGNGTLLDLDAKIASFDFGPAVRLFLNLRAGIGGASLRPPAAGDSRA
jgi:hypothetical protein